MPTFYIGQTDYIEKLNEMDTRYQSWAAGTSTFLDSLLTIKNATDETKVVKFDLSTFPTATTRTLTIPNGSGTLLLHNANHTINGSYTFSNTNNVFGNATTTGTTGLAVGATVSSSVKTVNIGTGGLSGSTTNVNIGSTTGTTNIALSGAVSVSSILAANGNIIARGGSGVSSEGGQIIIGYGNNTAASISGESNYTWNIDVAGGTANNNFRIFRKGSDGSSLNVMDVDEATGSIYLSQGQLKFPANSSTTSANPNTLDYYQEGSITPVVVGTTAAGSGTYTSQTGSYTRIGNRVFFDILFDISAHTGTGNMEVNGLPFTVGAVAQCNVRCTGMSFTGQLTAYVTGTKIVFEVLNNGAASALPIDPTCFVRVSGSYTV